MPAGATADACAPAVVDTHCHLELCAAPVDEIVARARAGGVQRIANVALEPRQAVHAITLARRHDEVFAIVGCHPNSAQLLDDDGLRALREAVRAAPGLVVAIGETGLDYYRAGAPRETQINAFRRQLELAAELSLPVVVHSREAADDTLAVLADYDRRTPVVLHCFGMPERIAECVERGYYCSFAGNVTYPAAQRLREAARVVPDELLLVETDAPFLSPQPVRGRPNEPSNVRHTLAALAELRGVSAAELAGTVERNARRVFGW